MKKGKVIEKIDHHSKFSIESQVMTLKRVKVLNSYWYMVVWWHWTRVGLIPENAFPIPNLVFGEFSGKFPKIPRHQVCPRPQLVPNFPQQCFPRPHPDFGGILGNIPQTSPIKSLSPSPISPQFSQKMSSPSPPQFLGNFQGKFPSAIIPRFSPIFPDFWGIFGTFLGNLIFLFFLKFLSHIFWCI